MSFRDLVVCCEGNAVTGAAWPSSARVVRCWVKSRNERNPCRLLNFSDETARANREEGGDDVRSAWPLRLGPLTCYNGRYNASAKAQAGANRIKTGPSSDWGLQLAPMKSELLVTVGQHTTVNTFPDLVHTARHITKVGGTRSTPPLLTQRRQDTRTQDTRTKQIPSSNDQLTICDLNIEYCLYLVSCNLYLAVAWQRRGPKVNPVIGVKS